MRRKAGSPLQPALHHGALQLVVSDHFTSTDAGIDEQHVELSRCQARPQRGNLIWISDVHGLDFESAVGSFQEIV
jgi:hypothetical protein